MNEVNAVPHLAILTEGGAHHAVAGWLAEAVRRCGDVEVDLLDLTEAQLPAVSPPDGPTPPAIRDFAPWLEMAAGFVIVVSPECPVALANTVDWCTACWRGKPVAFAGHAGELPAVRSLRLALAAAHAVIVPEVAVYRDRARTDRVLTALINRFPHPATEKDE